ncbi:MAG TPA: Maf family protein, partial [Chitinophagaceae bacterium]|nr:Maf family protein [Chitinophagaceae bacterium]
MNKIVLASQSPRRKQLLEWAEIPFEILVKETAETFPENLSSTEAAIYIARQKALAVKPEVKDNTTILAADTIVVLNGRLIGKPASREEAVEILSSLS